jgi:hypothetical protein
LSFENDQSLIKETMIQRIQTLYLLGATVLIALCFFLPLAALVSKIGQVDTLTLNNLAKGTVGKVIAFLAGLTVGMAFVSIFLYKRRKQQMVMCLILVALFIIINILTVVQIGQLKQTLGMMATYKLPLIFPLLSAVLSYLSYRGIKKDDELVQSYDRLR